MSTTAGSALDRRRESRIAVAGVAVVLVLLVAGLAWAKWLPYADKARALADTGTWPGSPIFQAGDAWAFTKAYFLAVWKAALVALVVAAALEALVPQRWLVGLLARRTTLGQTGLGGLLALPGMMCTCCTAPIAVGLRRSGAPLAATMAYWLANPLLNPAVILFLTLTLPWHYAVVRSAVGVLLVLGGSAAAARLAPRRALPAAPTDQAPVRWSQLPVRFARALARYLLVLVPEYVAVVLLVGWLSGRLSDFAGLDEAAGPLALLLVGVVGTLLVIPTGGEVPVIIGLTAAGVGAGVTGTLLITLPALSIPSMVMVGRALSWRATAALAGMVLAGGVLSGVLLLALPTP